MKGLQPVGAFSSSGTAVQRCSGDILALSLLICVDVLRVCLGGPSWAGEPFPGGGISPYSHQ